MLTIGYIGNGKSTNRYHLPFVLQQDNIKILTTQKVIESGKLGELLEVGMHYDKKRCFC
jgi:hypothetical protein